MAGVIRKGFIGVRRRGIERMAAVIRKGFLGCKKKRKREEGWSNKKGIYRV